MAIDYIVGPILALLLGMKFTTFKNKENEKAVASLEAKIEVLEEELPKKVMATMLPVAKAVQKLNQQVGL